MQRYFRYWLTLNKHKVFPDIFILESHVEHRGAQTHNEKQKMKDHKSESFRRFWITYI